MINLTLGNFDALVTQDIPMDTVRRYIQAEINRILPEEVDNKLKGKADLDAFGKLVCSQIPAGMDDLRRYPTINDFPSVDDTENTIKGRLYLDESTGNIYRFDGDDYKLINSSVAEEETTSINDINNIFK